jgi:hypothetical protein
VAYSHPSHMINGQGVIEIMLLNFFYRLGGCGLDSTGSGQGPVAGCGECGDEPSSSCATELVSSIYCY